MLTRQTIWVDHGLEVGRLRNIIKVNTTKEVSPEREVLVAKKATKIRKEQIDPKNLKIKILNLGR